MAASVLIAAATQIVSPWSEAAARYVAALTEFWRARRACAGVLHFCGLGYSRPNGQTCDDFVDIDWLTLRLNSTISSSWLNEGRYQWGRDNETQFSTPPFPGEPTNSIGGRSPQTFVNNAFSFGIPEFLERPAFPDERRNQFADTLTYTGGKAGLERDRWLARAAFSRS